MVTKVYVGNLPHAVSAHELAQAFSCFVEVVDSKISRQRPWGEMSHVGYVTVRDADTAARAVQHFDGRHFLGATLVVKPATAKKRDRAAPDRLH